ncbi:MAG: MGMT family protein, partial [Sulfolobales archaeon]
MFILLQLVPVGRVTTYKALARVLKTSPRAVGRMLKLNDRPIVVPCHRVVRASGELGGYTLGDGENSEFKLKLLKLEGVKLFGDRVSLENIIYLDEVLLGDPR